MTVRGDGRWMNHALHLARDAEGLTRPNPPVGAVLVKRGRVVGEGAHRKVGGPHAEIMALRQAGEAAGGSTLYVTLEPCCTTGRTPPCTEAVRTAGIRRVVVATRDPNPRHGGRGLELLREAGIQVEEGVGAEEGERLIEPFACWIRHQRPFFQIKLAASLDGRIADRTGTSKWITGPEARQEVQAMRRCSDAILVGAETVRRDDPSLRPRPARGRRPFRIVCDSHARVPVSRRLFQDGFAETTLVAVTREADPQRIRRIERTGAAVAVLPSARGRVSVKALARLLGRMGILRVLCEGGGELSESLARAGLVDEWAWFTAPCLLGGGGRSAVGGKGWPLAAAPKFTFTESRILGRDLLVRARPAK